ncbi:hypothetical protein LY90DRAFT_499056 [Neocallimastix californiae]|uniref:MATH domain-containing protein n=1 Tax=Neocallimastix californiae TaxID=1754190 RepID=A0A1Y2FP79_9FUNG|nr:hypothetical protein LY90DRAFT_499056 [Neocallimastix californiae]|eukprot:ORY85134.1 hypothetical protein LY90DRAFT_499056 [Neocallimastix californiae]
MLFDEKDLKFNEDIEPYITEIKELIEEKKDTTILVEDYYEWKIEDWSNLNDKEYSPIFNIASEYFSSNYSKYYFEKLIKRSLLYENTKKETSLIEDNKTVIGMYIRIYECKENNYLKRVYIKKLKDLLFQDSIDAYKVSYKGYHEWKINKSDIDKYRNDDNHKIVSPSFKLCGYTWNIEIKFEEDNSLNVYLISLNNNNNADDIVVKYVLSFRNCYSYTDSWKKNTLSKNIRDLIKTADENYDDVIGEGYYEWKIDNINKINDEITSPSFKAYDYNWSIII